MENEALKFFLNGQAIDPKVMTISEINVQK